MEIFAAGIPALTTFASSCISLSIREKIPNYFLLD